MKPEEINPFDWKRMLMGEVPGEFIWELLIRGLFVYVVLFVSLRLMGRRMAALITRNQWAALISVASCLSLVLHDPERGLLPPLLAAILVVSIHNLICNLTARNHQLEVAIINDLSIMVKDGKLQLKTMLEARLSRERLFAHLRYSQISNLGKVERVIMESSGKFSVYQFEEEKPGLSLIPTWDEEYQKEQEEAKGTFACASCGNLEKADKKPPSPCKNCTHTDWKQAIKA